MNKILQAKNGPLLITYHEYVSNSTGCHPPLWLHGMYSFERSTSVTFALELFPMETNRDMIPSSWSFVVWCREKLNSFLRLILLTMWIARLGVKNSHYKAQHTYIAEKSSELKTIIYIESQLLNFTC